MIKVSLAQFAPELGNKKQNIEKMKRLMKEAKCDQSQLILFPELSVTGYSVGEQLPNLAENREGESVKELQKACKELAIHAVISFPEANERGGGHVSAAIIDDVGDILGVYRKTHLFGDETEYFESGDDLPVFETKLGRIGLMICYDLEFPEVARILRIKQAELILVPTANMLPYQDYQLTYVKSRAMENELPIVLCNRIGTEKNIDFFGESIVVNAKGKILTKMEAEEGLVTVAIDLEGDLDSKLNYVNNRQPSLYGDVSRVDKYT